MTLFSGIGAQWTDISSPVNADDTLTLGHVMLFLLIDCAIAWLITWYVDAVFPGAYGVPKPWYFFVTVSSIGESYKVRQTELCKILTL